MGLVAKGNWRGRSILVAVMGGLAPVLMLASFIRGGDVPVHRDDVARPRVPPYLNMPSLWPVSPGQWVTVKAFPSLRFQTPTFLTFAPRTDLLFVCECAGVLKCFANDPGTKDVTTVLDLRHQCQSGSDSGLLGLAFHPDFGKKGSPNRGYFYLFYNYTDSPVHDPFAAKTVTHNRLSRFTIPEGSLKADPASETVLIEQRDEHCFHNGGSMFFHQQDGFLYVSLGDEGDARGKLGNCQQIDKDLFSGVIRIDVDKDPSRSHPPPRQPATGRTAHYFIPNDNPFVGVANALEEFWCIGLRSPHRMSHDPVSDKIWLGDVGEGDDAAPCEEVNLIVKGGNYQWNYNEGGLPRPGNAVKPRKIIGVEQAPVYSYPHTDNRRCVIGGHVYRGQEHQATLGGKYIFGDFSGMIWTMDNRAGKEPDVKLLCNLPVKQASLTSFGVDSRGELYLLTANGSVLKLAQAGSPAAPIPTAKPMPAVLSQTGAFRAAGTVSPAPGLIPYEVNVPFFSDNVHKQRWMALPFEPARANNPHIQFAPKGEWTFPAGTVFVKHFEMPLTEADPSVRTRLETRILVLDQEGGVYGVSYKWRADGGDADLLTGAHTETLPNGQNWYYPSSSDCLICHNAAAQFVLGVNARQLNCVVPAATGAAKNQLSSWSRKKLFDRQLSEQDLSQCDRLASPSDPSASVNEKARSYLDVNCAYCHRPLGVRGYFDARHETPLKKQKLINGPVFSDLGIVGARTLVPRDPGRSLILQRMKTCGDKKMPPLGRSVPDTAGIQVMEEWVLTMAPVKLVLTQAGLWSGGFIMLCIPAWFLRRRLVRRGNMVRWLPFLLALPIPLAMLLKVVSHPYWGLLETVTGLSAAVFLLAAGWLFGSRLPAVASTTQQKPEQFRSDSSLAA